MQETQNEIVDYYIVFTRARFAHWIFRLLDPEFQHVYAVKRSPGCQFWIIINPKRGFTSVTMETVDKYPCIRALCPGQIILNVSAKANNKCRQWVWHVNCVEIVKTLLGINRRRIITPKQLYNFLRG